MNWTLRKSFMVLVGLFVMVCGCGKKKDAPPPTQSGSVGKKAAEKKAARPVARKAKERTRAGGLFKRPVLKVRKVAGGHAVDFVLKRQASVPVGKVMFTVEPYVLTVRSRKETLDESNLFGTGLSLDLDGDGKTSGQLKVGCKPDGSAFVGNSRFAPLGLPSMTYLDEKGKSKVGRIGPKGAYGVLYSRCVTSGPVTFGIAPGAIPVKSVDSPALQLLAVEEAPDVRSQVKIRIEGLNVNGKPVAPGSDYSTLMFENMFGKPGWTTARWVMVPLDPKLAQHRVGLVVKGGDPSRKKMLILSVNTPQGKAGRMRTIVGARPLR